MTAAETHQIERPKQLPPARVTEVLDFMEFLIEREQPLRSAP